MSLFSRLLRQPLLHFLIIGGFLFFLQEAWKKYFEPPQVFVKKDLVISKNQIEQLKNDIFIQTGLQATPSQLERLIQTTIDEEILYLEALDLKIDKTNPSVRQRLIDLAKLTEDEKKLSDDILYHKALELGLDRNDLVVRRLLISTMQLIGKKIPTRKYPSKVETKDLEAYYQTHTDSFMKPAQVKFKHLYFSRDKRKANAQKNANEVFKKISSQGEEPEKLKDTGDAFLGGSHFTWPTLSFLERLFGPDFSQSLSKLPVGKWSGPLASIHGWHLVFIEDIKPSKPFTLKEVEGQIKASILKEREQQRLVETIKKLRLKYNIVIEKTDTP